MRQPPHMAQDIMERPSNPRICALAARQSVLPAELVEPILAQLPLHRVLELSLVPTASSRLISIIGNSPSWAWVFRHHEGAFEEAQQLYKATNELSWLYCRQPFGLPRTTLEYFTFYQAAARKVHLDVPGFDTDPLIAARSDFLRFLKNLLSIPGSHGSKIRGFTKSQFEALCIFLPADILVRIESSLDGATTEERTPWAKCLTCPPDSDELDRRVQALHTHPWTTTHGLAFVPYLLQAYQDLVSAQSAELCRLADLYEQYPSLLRTSLAPQTVRSNPKHIPNALRRDSELIVSRPLCAWNRDFEWYRFRDRHPCLIPYTWSLQSFREAIDRLSPGADHYFPDHLLTDLNDCLSGWESAMDKLRYTASERRASPHSLLDLEWLESFVRCADWLYANAENLTSLQRVPGKVLLSPADYNDFIETESPQTIAQQLKLDSAICDADSTHQLPSLMALYLPPHSSRKSKAIANQLSPDMDVATRKLIYQDLVKRLRFKIQAGPAFEVRANNDRSVLDTLMLEKGDGVTAGSSWTEGPWHNFEKRYTASKMATSQSGRKACYICRHSIKKEHDVFASMCEPCGEFNLAGSSLSQPENLHLPDTIALVTGARLNLGFHTALRLLRCGASVIASTRYPKDALCRYKSESDFAVWKDRLRVVGADFRAATDAFGLVHQVRHIVGQWGGRLDILINNAAQTLTDSVEKETAAVDKELSLEGATHLMLSDQYTPRVRGGVSETLSITHRDRHDTDSGTRVDMDDLANIQTSVPTEADSNQSGSPDSQVRHNRGPAGPSSWVQSLSEIPYEDIISAQSVNALVPLILVRELLPLMSSERNSRNVKDRTEKTTAYIVNVSSREGISEFTKKSSAKNGKHVHTNMSKAALNMITETEAHEAWRKHRVAMNTVDPGYMSAAPEFQDAYGGERPIGWEDGAGRVLWPIAIGESVAMQPVWGKFLKHYGASRVDVRVARTRMDHDFS